MNNILLIHPFAGRRTFCPPLGTLYIAAALREAGYEVSVLDLDVEDLEDRELTGMVNEMAPLFTGISCNVVQVNEALRLSHKIKGAGGRVVMGGPIVSAVPELFLETTDVDFCVIGEGERTVVELAQALGDNLPVEDVPGLAYKAPDRAGVKKTPPRPFITELDRLPFPAHDLNGDMGRYARIPSPAPSPPIAAVLPSRGCPFRCTFCSNPWQGTNRKRSAENVVREISWLVSDFRIKEFFFYDDSFNSDPEYIKELCTRMMESGLNINWRADCRADGELLDEEMLRLMKESGCWLLAFGVEAGNQRVIRSIRKGLKLEDVRRARELCKGAGILFRSFFMIGNLGEDYCTVFDTIRLAEELDPDDCQFSILTPIIGTPAYETAKENGWLVDRQWEHLDSFHATVSTDKLSALDAETLHKLASLTVRKFWMASLKGVPLPTGDTARKMEEAHGRKGRMIYELWESYNRNSCREKPVVVLNPPSPPGFTASRDTMGGFGQMLKGDFLSVIPPVDMAYLAARLRKDEVDVHTIDATGSFLDEEYTIKFVASLSPSLVMVRTSVPTRDWDRAFGERMASELNVEVEYFGPCVEGGCRAAVEDIPLPAWDLLPAYNLGALTDNRRYLPIQGSRGCPYECDYCPYPIAQGTVQIARKPEHIVEEMLHWKRELGVDYFLFRDPVFTLRSEWVSELCRLLRGEGISWRCETRADLLDDHLLEEMVEAGCTGINLGIETVTEVCLDKVHRKPIAIEKLKAVVEKCNNLGIGTFVFYIVGLPGENRESFRQTLDLASELATPHIQFLPAMPYPGTRLRQWAEGKGFITGSLTDPAHYGTEPVMRNEHLSVQDIKELCETAQRSPGMSAHSVGAAKCDSYGKAEEAVKKAVDELGGMGAFVKPGQLVLLKPNLIGAYPPERAATTHPAVVKAVASLVKEAGGIPVIGDSPGGGEVYHYKSYRNLLRVTGMEAVAQTLGCETVDFSSAGVSTIPLDGKRLKELVITDAALKADVIISLPKVKTHTFQYFTGALKNMYGLVPGLQKAHYHKIAPSPREFASLMVDVFQAVKDKVKLVVMDAVISMDGRGPTAGQPVATGFVLAGREAVIADSAACLILGLDPQQSPIIAEACQRFLKGGRFNINIKGEELADLKTSSFRPPFFESQDSFIETHANIHPYIDGVRCEQCRKCIQSCPVKTIGDDFVIDAGACIKCLCCFEVCPHNAIELVKQREVEQPVVKLAPPRSSVEGDKLKVLVISNLYPPHFIGGYELACREVVDKLRERGHEVMVLTSMFGMKNPVEEEHVRRILDHSYGAGDGAFFMDMPFSAYNEHIIESVMDEFHPHSLYLWNFHGLSMQSVMQTVAGSNVPYLFHAMDYHLLAGHGSLQKWQEQVAGDFLSSPRCRIAAMSETVRVKFLRQGYLEAHLVYHGVDLTEPVEKVEGDGLRLIYSGQTRYNKGLHVLIQALHAAGKEGYGISLDIFGKGDLKYEEQIRRFVEDQGMPVVFHGALPRSELLEKYGRYDAFVFPTLQEEPFGIVMIEAMNAGLPVIASGDGGPKEIIAHGETGLWFPTGDAERLKNCLIELCRSEELRRRLSVNGRALVKEKFDIQKSVSQIEGLLDFSKQPISSAEREGKSTAQIRATRGAACAPKKKGGGASIVWNAPVYDPSGYADEARNFVMALERHGGARLKLNPIRWSDLTTDLGADTMQKLQSITERGIEGDYANVMHIFPRHFRRDPQAAVNIGRTTYETDRIPIEWVDACNRMDEIWVPTEFNLQTFARSGVAEDKLFKVPACIDTEKFRPNIPPMRIEGSAGFNFLSPFDWCLRKGWDVLLRAYCREFDRDEDVALIFKVYSTLGYGPEQIRECVNDYIRKVLRMEPRNAPRIIFLERILPDREMPRLYRAAQALVMPSRCEGWGRPFMEAMAMGLPTIGTGWSGNLEFMDSSNSFLIDYQERDVPEEAWREIPMFRGHRWAEPSEEHLRELMRQVFSDRTVARKVGKTARRHIIKNYNWDSVADIIVERVNSLIEGSGKTAVQVSVEKHRLVWEGQQFTNLSLAVVNRNLCYYLDREESCELGLQSDETGEDQLTLRRDRFSPLAEKLNVPLEGPADFHVRHGWPPDFTPPESGHWIMMQPWEFGALPESWVDPMENLVDELWVPSSYVKQCYIESGISPEKVFIIPNGVDTEIFNPRAEPIPLATEKRFRFLFVGGLFFRKGIDLLLKAYLSAFTKRDDVCLVIKDFGSSYGDGFRLAIDQTIRECQSTPGAPEVLRISEELSDEQMAGLYRACHCLVHPYRGEGFGLPVAEAMACGMPVIVTKGGASDEFCTDDTVYFVPAVRVETEMQEKIAGRPWLLEPDAETLIERMKYLVSHPTEARELGRAAAELISSRLSWEKSAQAVLKRLDALREKPVRRFQKSLPERGDEVSKSKVNSKGYDLEELYRLVETHPEQPFFHNQLGEALFYSGEHEEARREFEKALQLDSACIDAQNNLGAIHWARGEMEEALVKFRQVLKTDESNPDALVNCGMVCAQSGRDEEAVELLKKYLSLSGEDLEARFALSEVLRRNGKIEEAQEELHLILDDDPNHHAARELLEAMEQPSA